VLDEYKRMKNSILILIISLFISSVISTSCFLWSNSDFFDPKTKVLENKIEASEFGNFDSKSSKIPLSSKAQHSKLEFFVVYIHPTHLSMNQEVYPTVRKMIDGSKSSLILARGPSSNDLVSELVSNKNQIINVAEEEEKSTSTFSFSQFAKKIPHFSKNEKMNIAIVHLSSDQSQNDRIISQLEGEMKSIEHISLFTFEESKIEKQNELKKRQTPTDSGDNWPLGVVMGLAFSAPLLVIVLIGFWCTFQLQSEFKFDAETSAANILKKHK